MLMKYIFIISLIFISIFQLDARNVDSLKVQLSQAERKDSANLLLLVAYYSRYDDQELMKSYSEKAYDLAIEFDDIKNKGRSLYLIGLYYAINADVFNAKIYLENAIKVNTERGDTNDIMNCYVGLGMAYENLGELDKALSFYNQALKIAKAGKRVTSSIDAYANISNIQKTLKEYNKALESLMRCAEIFEEYNMQESSKAYMIYNNIGTLYLDIKEFRKALDYFNKALKGYESFNSNLLIVKTFTNIGLSYIGLEQLQEAKKYFDKAEKMAIENNMTAELIFNTAAFAELYYSMRKYDLAIEKAVFAYDLSLENKWKEQTMQISYLLYKFYKARNLKHQALEYLEKYQKLYEEIYQESQQKLISELEVKYNTELKIEKKQSEIRELEIQKELDQEEITRQKSIRNGSVVLAVLLILLFILLVNRYRLKAAKDKAEKKNLTLQVDYKNRELVSSSVFISEKNRLLTELQNKISELKIDDLDHRKEIRSVQKEINGNIDLEEDWNKMKLHFDEVFPSFFDKLNEMKSDLTHLDLKHCAYLKMNLSIKEISRILGVEATSVQMSHYRLKKKLDLPNEQSLSEFLARV